MVFEFLPPDLSGIDVATDRDREYAAKYTRIRRVYVEGGDTPDAHTTWLVVDGQSFRVDQFHHSAEEAAWFCWQLGRALQRVVDDEGKE